MNEPALTHIDGFLQHIAPFDQLPAKALAEISREVEIRYFASGEMVIHAQDPAHYLYVIRRGSVEQRKPDGVLRARLGEADLFGFGLLSSASDAPHYQVMAIEDTLLYLIPYQRIAKLCHDDPKLADHFAFQVQARLQSALNVVWSQKEKGLFFKKIEEVTCGAIAKVDVNDSIQSVAQTMRVKVRTSCAVVFEQERIVGLVTDRDLTLRVIAEGVDIQAPISTVMTPNPMTIDNDDLVLKAASIMMQNDIKCLPILQGNKVKGLLSTNHLVQNHRVQAIFLIEKIKYCHSTSELAKLSVERQAIFEALVDGQVVPSITGQVMSMIMDAYTRRLIAIAIDKLGQPPCPFAWIVAGSQARNEVHMCSDQDNAIVLANHASRNDKLYFQHLSMMVCNGLARCGYPLCSGRFMAANPAWCQPVSVWHQYYHKWISNPEYESLLNLTVFLETRTLVGDAELEVQMRSRLGQQLSDQSSFFTNLVNDINRTKPPLGIFNSLVLETSGENSRTLNIKKNAINIIIDLARVYGLAAGSDVQSTEGRFQAAYQAGVLSKETCDNVVKAYQYLLSVRLFHQRDALKYGKVADSQIDPQAISHFERQHLKDAFRVIADLQEAAKLKFGMY